ncbi:hypothetical protein HY489_03345 [Candidatus Woesearchaeota archaeon]|nr:hypothetical protein [Candidatus Woesearchaeota archaeon]
MSDVVGPFVFPGREVTSLPDDKPGTKRFSFDISTYVIAGLHLYHGLESASVAVPKEMVHGYSRLDALLMTNGKVAIIDDSRNPAVYLGHLALLTHDFSSPNGSFVLDIETFVDRRDDILTEYSRFKRK